MDNKPAKTYDQDPEARNWLKHASDPRKPGVPADYVPPVVEVEFVKKPSPSKPKSS